MDGETSRVNEENLEIDNVAENVKKKKPGIIYLAYLPPYMNVTKVKQIFSEFGTLGRIFLQPVESNSGKNKKKKPAVHFSEGWIEFERKKVAKFVALNLHNTQIGGKKSSKFYDYRWNIKYLSRFKWYHLSERLAYEKAVRRQKLRAEIAQAKREANYFAANVEKSKKFKKLKGNKCITNKYKLKKTVDELSKNSSIAETNDDRTEFLKSIFVN